MMPSASAGTHLVPEQAAEHPRELHVPHPEAAAEQRARGGTKTANAAAPAASDLGQVRALVDRRAAGARRAEIGSVIAFGSRRVSTSIAASATSTICATAQSAASASLPRWTNVAAASAAEAGTAQARLTRERCSPATLRRTAATFSVWR